jgi:hypothetical protein
MGRFPYPMDFPTPWGGSPLRGEVISQASHTPRADSYPMGRFGRALTTPSPWPNPAMPRATHLTMAGPRLTIPWPDLAAPWAASAYGPKSPVPAAAASLATGPAAAAAAADGRTDGWNEYLTRNKRRPAWARPNRVVSGRAGPGPDGQGQVGRPAATGLRESESAGGGGGRGGEPAELEEHGLPYDIIYIYIYIVRADYRYTISRAHNYAQIHTSLRIPWSESR